MFLGNNLLDIFSSNLARRLYHAWIMQFYQNYQHATINEDYLSHLHI